MTGEDLHTPTLATLHAQVAELVAEELRACLLDCDTRHEALEKARIDLVRFHEERDAAQEEFDRLSEPDPQKLAQRRTSEADHPEALVRKRRLREHEREKAAARARLERCKQLCTEAEKQIRECTVVIETRWKVAAEQAKSWGAHFDRRVATYWQRLIRIHRSGPRINELLPPSAWRMPDWVHEPIKAAELAYEHRPVTVANEGI